MIKRENDNDLPPFWNETQTNVKVYYKNSLTGLVTDRRPESVRGGKIFAFINHLLVEIVFLLFRTASG